MLFHCLTNDFAEELPSVLLLFSFCFVALEKIVSPFLKGQWKTVNAPKVGSSGMISASTHLLAMDPFGCVKRILLVMLRNSWIGFVSKTSSTTSISSWQRSSIPEQVSDPSSKTRKLSQTLRHEAETTPCQSTGPGSTIHRSGGR